MQEGDSVKQKPLTEVGTVVRILEHGVISIRFDDGHIMNALASNYVIVAKAPPKKAPVKKAAPKKRAAKKKE